MFLFLRTKIRKCTAMQLETLVSTCGLVSRQEGIFRRKIIDSSVLWEVVDGRMSGSGLKVDLYAWSEEIPLLVSTSLEPQKALIKKNKAISTTTNQSTNPSQTTEKQPHVVPSPQNNLLYCVLFRSPPVQEREMLERVKHKTTKMNRSLEHLSYEERLRELG